MIRPVRIYLLRRNECEHVQSVCLRKFSSLYAPRRFFGSLQPTRRRILTRQRVIRQMGSICYLDWRLNLATDISYSMAPTRFYEGFLLFCFLRLPPSSSLSPTLVTEPPPGFSIHVVQVQVSSDIRSQGCRRKWEGPRTRHSSQSCKCRNTAQSCKSA